MIGKKLYQSSAQQISSSTSRGYAKTLKSLKPLLSLRQSDFILDVGCGIGQLTILLNDYSPNIVGVDLSIKNLHEMKKRYRNLELVIADAEFLPFKISSFDKVFAFGVLEHVPNPFSALNEIARCLRKQGKLTMLQTYRLDKYQMMFHKLLYLLRLTKESVSSIEKEHINQFKPEIWEQQIKRCGLKLIAVFTTSIIPTFPFYYILSQIFPEFSEQYFNLPLIRNLDRWLKKKRVVAEKLALANIYISRSL